MKRFLDLILSGAVLLITFPLSIAVSVGIRVRMGTPIFFRQTRIGRNEVSFRIVKFRTMHPPSADCESDAERLTPLGRWLRQTSLDELPSLINVLRGDMSLVGPRPLLPRYLPYYRDTERLRHQVRPGVTGWAQIHGRNELEWDDRLAQDIWYVRNRSLLLDLKILWRTLALVLNRRGVVSAPETTQLDLDEVRK